ncbi:LuxR C-terminal-related transcriptional regulator [Cupriavidus basilensis]
MGVRGYRQVPPALPAGVPGNGHCASISTPALLHDGFDYEEAQILGLTPRQYEVLVLLARGHPLKVISRELNISVPTVKPRARPLQATESGRQRRSGLCSTATGRSSWLGKQRRAGNAGDSAGSLR